MVFTSITDYNPTGIFISNIKPNMKFSLRPDMRNRYLNYPSEDLSRFKKEVAQGTTTIREIEKDWVITKSARIILEKAKPTHIASH